MTLTFFVMDNMALLVHGTKAKLWVKQHATKVIIRLSADLQSLLWADKRRRQGTLVLSGKPLVVRCGIGRKHKAKRRLSFYRAAKASLSLCIDMPNGYADTRMQLYVTRCY